MKRQFPSSYHKSFKPINMAEEQEVLDREVEVVDKMGLQQQQLEELFHQMVTNFKLRWMNKNPPTYISQAGLYNYAMSIMQYEFQKIFDKDTRERLVEFYKP